VLGRERRVELKEQAAPLFEEVKVMLQESRDQGLEAENRSYAYDQMEDMVRKCLRHANEMSQWVLLKEEAAALLQLASDLKVALERGTRSLIDEKALQQEAQEALRDALGRDPTPLDRPGYSPGFRGVRATEAALEVRLSSAALRARGQANAARPDAKDVAPPSGSLDLPPLDVESVSVGTGGLDGMAGLDFSFSGTSLVFGEFGVLRTDGAEPTMEKSVSEAEAHTICERLDGALEELAEGEASLFTPRQNSTEDQMERAEGRAEVMRVQLQHLTGSQVLHARTAVLGENRLRQMQAALAIEDPLMVDWKGESPPSVAVRGAAAAARIQAYEAILGALACLDEGHLATARTGSRPGSRQGGTRSQRARGRLSRPVSRPGSRPMSRGSQRPSKPLPDDMSEANIWRLMCAGAHQEMLALNSAQENTQEMIERNAWDSMFQGAQEFQQMAWDEMAAGAHGEMVGREKNVWDKMSAGVHEDMAAKEKQTWDEMSASAHEEMVGREKNVFEMMAQGAHEVITNPAEADSQ